MALSSEAYVGSADTPPTNLVAPIKSTVPVILLGSGITAVGSLRCLSRRGIRVYSISRDDPYLRASRWYEPLSSASQSLRHPSGLNRFLSGLELDRAVLMPCSDAWVIAAAELTPENRQRFKTSLPAPEVIRRLIDKLTLGGFLREIELPHPRSIPIAGEAHLKSLLNDIKGSFFLKPRDSLAFHDHFGTKAFLVETPESALSTYHRVRSAKLDVILQEYIPGPESNHYYVEGFIDRHGEFTAWFARRRLRMYPPLFGNSTYMQTVPLKEVAGAVNATRHLLHAAKYRGIFSAEFKLDERDELFKLLEVNIRPWWYVEVPFRCGMDVMSMAYLDALEMEVPKAGTYAIGRRFYSPYFDLSACQDLTHDGKLGRWQWGRSWLQGKSVFFAWDDPLPNIQAFWALIRRKIKNRLSGDHRRKSAGSKSG